MPCLILADSLRDNEVRAVFVGCGELANRINRERCACQRNLRVLHLFQLKSLSLYNRNKLSTSSRAL